MTYTSPQPRVYRERPVTSRRRDNTNATHPWRVVGGTTADGRDRWTVAGRYDHVFATIVDYWNDPARASREAQASAIAAKILHPEGRIDHTISGPLDTIIERLSGLQLKVWDGVDPKVRHYTVLPADTQTPGSLEMVCEDDGLLTKWPLDLMARSKQIRLELPIDQFIAKVGRHV